MNKNKTQTYPLRIEQAQLDLAKRLGLNIAEIMRAALAEAIDQGVCPCCGGSIETPSYKKSKKK